MLKLTWRRNLVLSSRSLQWTGHKIVPPPVTQTFPFSNPWHSRIINNTLDARDTARIHIKLHNFTLLSIQFSLAKCFSQPASSRSPFQMPLSACTGVGEAFQDWSGHDSQYVSLTISKAFHYTQTFNIANTQNIGQAMACPAWPVAPGLMQVTTAVKTIHCEVQPWFFQQPK